MREARLGDVERIDALEVYQRDLRSHIDILMQNDARIDTLETLEAKVKKLLERRDDEN